MSGSQKRYDETGDFFETPPEAVLAIAPFLPSGRDVLDPAAGKGSILKTLRDFDLVPKALELRAIELNPVYAADCKTAGFATMVGDALELDWVKPDLVVMNPPYHLSRKFVERALAMRKRGGYVFALLRQGFSAGGGRRAFHVKHPSDMRILPLRPSFERSVRCANFDVCGTAWRISIDAERPRACTACGGKVKISSSDSHEYAWFCYGPELGGRWSVLDSEGARLLAKKGLVAA